MTRTLKRDPFRVMIETTWISAAMLLIQAIFSAFPSLVFLEHRLWSFWSVYWIYASFAVTLGVFAHATLAVMRYVLYRSGHTWNGIEIALRRTRWFALALAGLGIVMGVVGRHLVYDDWVTALGAASIIVAFLMLTAILKALREYR